MQVTPQAPRTTTRLNWDASDRLVAFPAQWEDAAQVLQSIAVYHHRWSSGQSLSPPPGELSSAVPFADVTGMPLSSTIPDYLSVSSFGGEPIPPVSRESSQDGSVDGGSQDGLGAGPVSVPVSGRSGSGSHLVNLVGSLTRDLSLDSLVGQSMELPAAVYPPLRSSLSNESINGMLQSESFGGGVGGGATGNATTTTSSNAPLQFPRERVGKPISPRVNASPDGAGDFPTAGSVSDGYRELIARKKKPDPFDQPQGLSVNAYSSQTMTAREAAQEVLHELP